jgi:hypothetical protein
MNPTPALSSLQNSNPLLAILWAGLTCGTLDITAALVVYGRFGLPPMRLLQGIAAGLLGPRALEGGLATALLGLLCHFSSQFAPLLSTFLRAAGSPSFLSTPRFLVFYMAPLSTSS